MGLITKDDSKRIDIPHEPGEWMELRSLTWREMKLARERRMDEAIGRAAAFPADFMKGLAEKSAETGDEPAAATPAQDDFDAGTVLAAGITGWSYSTLFDEDSVGTLDPVTAEWANLEILKLCGVDVDEGEGSGPS